jgi:glycosyltransferase involved in cell wall biosynthesis
VARIDASWNELAADGRGSGMRTHLSVVIPLWNEEESIAPLMERLRPLAAASSIPWQLVFVNDGSTDRTEDELLSKLDGSVDWILVRLSRNFGQQAAYRAGLEAASGDAVVFLDADLQDPPELIPEMVRLWQDGAKLVIGRRRSRAESGLRRALFDLFHVIFHRLTSGAMPKDSGTFGLMDRIIVDELKRMPELNLFLPALRCWLGHRQEILWYDRAVRIGEPKQSMQKLFSYAWDGITSFSILPLRAISLLGALVSGAAFLYALVLICIRFLQIFGYFPDLTVLGFTTLAVAIFGLGGIQLLCLGLIGEYLAKVYREVKRRPPYIVEHVRSSKDLVSESRGIRKVGSS